MHARKRGKSRSDRPLSKEPPEWVKVTPEEAEALVVRLAKEGASPSRIGVILRDMYGIPLISQITGKSITQILQENNLLPDIPEDLANLIERARRMQIHLSANKSDRYNKKRLQLVEAKIHRLVKYYSRIGRIPKDFKVKTLYTYA